MGGSHRGQNNCDYDVDWRRRKFDRACFTKGEFRGYAEGAHSSDSRKIICGLTRRQ